MLITIDHILAKEHKEAGFFLTQDGTNVYLWNLPLVPIAVFPLENGEVTLGMVSQIQYEANQELNWDKSGISFEREAHDANTNRPF